MLGNCLSYRHTPIVSSTSHLITSFCVVKQWVWKRLTQLTVVQ